MRLSGIRFRTRLKQSAKSTAVHVVFFFLGRAFQVLSRRDPIIREEIQSWKQGFTLKMQVRPLEPSVILARKGDRIEALKPNGAPRADMSVQFRSLDAAFLVMSGQIGIAQAYAQHRFSLKGSIADCMVLVRCVDIIEGYLFPKFIARKILKQFPKKECSTVSVYCRAILGG